MSQGQTRPSLRARKLRSRWPMVVAGTSLVAYLVVAALTLWFGYRSYLQHAPADVGPVSWNAVNVLTGIVFGIFVVAGAVIVSRRPRNTVGWLMVAGGLGFALRNLGDMYSLVAVGGAPDDPAPLAVAVKVAGIMGARLGAMLLVVFLPLVYPDGRLPTPRWKPAASAAGLFALLWSVSGIATGRLTGVGFPSGREPVEIYDVANPLATPWLQPLATPLSGSAGTLLLLGFTVVAVLAVVVRFRRSETVEREQMKWFVYAAGLYAALFGASIVVPQAFDASASLIHVLQGFAYLALGTYPVAIGVAVLRYRLYAIDRLISRTVAYGLIVAVLGGVYVVGVVGLGEVVAGLTGQQDSDLVVAVSVLAVAAAFGPVRSRVRTAVDRRFNRTGYQARRAVETFTSNVRDEVDLDVIRARTAETVAAAVEPTHVSVWLADSRASSPRHTMDHE